MEGPPSTREPIRASVQDSSVTIAQTQVGLTISFRTNGEDHAFTFEEGEITIGRRKDCDVVIQNSSISRLHATVKFANGRWTLYDNDSANGLAVGGRLVTEHAVVDDRVLMGDVAVHFRVKLPVEMGGGVLHSEQKLSSSIDVGSLDNLLETMFQDENAHTQTQTQPLSRQGLAPRESLTAADVILMMRAVTDAFLSNDDVDSILRTVLNLLFDHLPINQASILLFDEKTGQLTPRLQRTAGSATNQRIRMSRHIANEAVTSKKAVLVLDAEQDPRFDASASIVSLGIRSAMAVPLCHKGKVSGLIYVDRRASNIFTHADLELLSVLAGLSAAAVERAVLHARIERDRRIRERLSRYNAPQVIDYIVETDELVESGAMVAEEREVTVMFADVSGFTGLSENLPAREVTGLLNEVFEALTHEVFKESGTLDKFIGDAVMVFFGAPLAQPDHAARAIRVALAMQESVARMNATKDGAPLGLRIGINTGPVVVGDVGAQERRDYTVIGDTVNTASRIESYIATVGTVVVGPATRDAAADQFEFEELDSIQLKGKSHPIVTYRVLGAADGSATRAP